MLKGPGKYWPKSSTGKLFSLNDVVNNANNWSAELFCVNCHPLYSGGTWKNVVHEEHQNRTRGPDNEMSCVYCHVAVPHGSKRSRLIGYNSDPSPYDYNDNRLLVTGFCKGSTPQDYSRQKSCTTVSGCHRGGMWNFGCTSDP